MLLWKGAKQRSSYAPLTYAVETGVPEVQYFSSRHENSLGCLSSPASQTYCTNLLKYWKHTAPLMPLLPRQLALFSCAPEPKNDVAEEIDVGIDHFHASSTPSVVSRLRNRRLLAFPCASHEVSHLLASRREHR